jgi:hypothetical protein
VSLRFLQFLFTKGRDFQPLAMKFPPSLFSGRSVAWSRLFLAALFVALGPLSLPAQNAASKPVRVLIFGNSFSGNSTRHLAALAKEGGKNLTFLNLVKGGCSLEEHAAAIKAAETDPESPKARFYMPRGNAGERFASKKKINVLEAIQAGSWDYVSIQQYSLKSIKAETYEPHAKEVIDFIRSKAPEAKILVHETWAYRHDDPIFKDGTLTPAKMHEALRINYLNLARNYGLLFLPIGDAFQAASQTPEWTYVKDMDFDYQNPPKGSVPKQPGSLHTGWIWKRIGTNTATPDVAPTNEARRSEEAPLKFVFDGHHANSAGEYLGSCVWYEFLFQDDVTKLTTYRPASLTAEQAASLRKIAHETVAAQRKSQIMVQ